MSLFFKFGVKINHPFKKVSKALTRVVESAVIELEVAFNCSQDLFPPGHKLFPCQDNAVISKTNIMFKHIYPLVKSPL